MKFEDFEAVKYWRKSLAGCSEETWRKYLFYLGNFCNFIRLSPDQLIQQRKEDLKNEDPRIQRRVELDLKAFIADLAEKGASPNSQRVAYNAIKSFLARHYVPLQLFRSDSPKGEALSIRRVPTKEEIHKMCVLADLRDRFLILLLKDTGLRISDVVRLKYGQIRKEFEEGKQFINIQLLTKKKRIRANGFIGPETTEVLGLYLGQRKKGTNYLYGEHLKKGIPPETISDESWLIRSKYDHGPITTESAFLAIKALAKAIGVEDISPHSFRRFFQTNLEAGGVDPNWRRLLMGKKVRSEEEGYSRPTTEMLREIYEKAYSHLAIGPGSTNRIKELEEEIAKLRAERVALERKLNSELGVAAERETRIIELEDAMEKVANYQKEAEKTTLKMREELDFFKAWLSGVLETPGVREKLKLKIPKKKSP